MEALSCAHATHTGRSESAQTMRMHVGLDDLPDIVTKAAAAAEGLQDAGAACKLGIGSPGEMEASSSAHPTHTEDSGSVRTTLARAGLGGGELTVVFDDKQRIILEGPP